VICYTTFATDKFMWYDAVSRSHPRVRNANPSFVISAVQKSPTSVSRNAEFGLWNRFPKLTAVIRSQGGRGRGSYRLPKKKRLLLQQWHKNKIMSTALQICYAYWFRKRQGISWLAEWLLASKEGLCSMELVS